MLLDSRTRPIHQILEAYLPPDTLAYALRLWSEEYLQQTNISMLSFVDAFYHRQSLPYSRQHIYNSLLPALMEVLTIRNSFDENTTDLYEFPDYDRPLPEVAQPGPTTVVTQQPVLIRASEETPVAPAPAPTPAPRPVAPTPRQERPAIQSKAAPRPPAVVSKPPVRDEKFEAFSTFVRKLMRSLSAERRKKMLFFGRKNFVQSVPASVATSFYEWLQTEDDYFEHADLDIASMSNVVHHIYAGLCNYLGPLEADDVLMKSANHIDTHFSREALDVRDLL